MACRPLFIIHKITHMGIILNCINMHVCMYIYDKPDLRAVLEDNINNFAGLIRDVHAHGMHATHIHDASHEV